ncbi:MAG: xanthan lyase, partial [Muribaculaceae bacterium]|nr:xanthan lyase [Muribaculaceae bacterium]
AGAGFAYNFTPLHVGDNPFRAGTSMMSTDPKAKAEWRADVPEDGTYAVYVGYTSQPKSSKRAVYTVKTAAGDRRVAVNQNMGGGTWIYLGHFPLKAGEGETVVELVNEGSKGSVLTADAVKIGGGMGNVARIVKDGTDGTDYQYVTSGYPRFVEAARYFLQWAGAPDSVYTPSNNVNDYTDDYRSRGLWVNWMAGGSSMLPGREGLGVPVDLSFAFHTDSGTTPDDSIIGTLGIYSTADKTLGNGGDRLASRDLTTLVMNNIVRDVRAKHEPQWTRRGMWDQRYFEARVPEVPSMLLEFLSHQNFADMKYGLDPEFRFDVSRAIYKGMLQFLAHRDGRDYVVQPLPVGAFAIRSAGAGTYRLTWRATPDSLEATAMPTYYLLHQRDGLKGDTIRTIAHVE